VTHTTRVLASVLPKRELLLPHSETLRRPSAWSVNGHAIVGPFAGHEISNPAVPLADVNRCVAAYFPARVWKNCALFLRVTLFVSDAPRVQVPSERKAGPEDHAPGHAGARLWGHRQEE